jgi:hypothetical protein
MEKVRKLIKQENYFVERKDEAYAKRKIVAQIFDQAYIALEVQRWFFVYISEEEKPITTDERGRPQKRSRTLPLGVQVGSSNHPNSYTEKVEPPNAIVYMIRLGYTPSVFKLLSPLIFFVLRLIIRLILKNKKYHIFSL